MKRIELAGELRTEVGSKESKLLRAENNVPCILYGGEEPHHFFLNGILLDKYVFTPEVYLYEIEIDGKKYLASMKEVQFHPVTDKPIHVDFLELDESKEAKVAIPVRLLGIPIGVRNGGRLNQNYRKITIKGLPDQLPEFLEVNVDDIQIGQSIRIEEITVDGLQIMEDPSEVLVTVKMARTVIEEEEIEDEEGEEGEEGTEGAEGGEPTEGGDAKPAEGGSGEEKKEGGE